MPAAAKIEGRIPGFNTRWNKMQNDIISTEDRLRWAQLDRQEEARKASGVPRPTVKLPRAHSAIGPFPGCRRIVELSPRRSAACNYIEEKLIRSASVAEQARPSTQERLYLGVSAEEKGRHEYLKRRKVYGVREKFGNVEMALPTTSMQYGFLQPTEEYRASKFCHKPFIENTFYRVSGAETHRNLPDPTR
mmetsp:Transcript_5311/g.11790  ORF Transcript_5311/g.11790 Transcript_5311/m.11790 type:complete len:191 (+) Transcript_5311:118-690(+)|eukprot:CAMPEP_0178416040 /NCGR_PEP_ID=MMETSP0689_2-20121128/23857_1 /TAXON_ID=160604 /ORGANISM="Amphidinium massartii, Strain CS-259" /LENGTH=190 /DNA_ID=CAMNT_0020037369 /DNA_START=103 /DNA_END=675 /DNA_ORIENTATION=-